MNQTIIVAARPLPEPLVQALSRLGVVRVYDPDDSASALAGASIWVGTAVDPVDADLIARFPDTVGLIANLGVGTDNIDLAAAAARGIRVSNTPVVTEDTADLTMALLLATCRRLGVCERLLRAGDWAGGAGRLGQRVHGRTLGIVGFGDIGQAVARRARGFDMPVLYHGPRRKPEAEAALDARYCGDLAELLREADIVSLHCPLQESTRHIIDGERLGQMKPGAVLINTGRGPLVHEDALVAALRSGHLGGAGLDVFEFEPRVTEGLKAFDNVTLLPHIGSATGECRTDVATRLIANIQAFLADGRPVDDCLPARS